MEETKQEPEPEYENKDSLRGKNRIRTINEYDEHKKNLETRRITAREKTVARSPIKWHWNPLADEIHKNEKLASYHSNMDKVLKSNRHHD